MSPRNSYLVLILLSALSSSVQAVVTQIIDYDFDIRDGTAGVFQNMGGTDYVSTTVITTGAVINPGGGSEKIEWLGNSTTLNVPTAPWLTSVNLTTAGSSRVDIGSVASGGAGLPGAGVSDQLANNESLTFTFDQAIAITEIDMNWWDNAASGTPDQIAITVNGTTYNNPTATGNAALNFSTGVGGAFPTTSFSDPLSGNSVTGVAVSAGSPITFTVWDTNGSGDLVGNGLVQGLKFAVVPEPSRALLFLAAAATLVLRRRR